MARLTKAIVRAGVHNVSTPNGERRWETILPERLQHWADQANEMIASGHSIPAPFSHDPSATPVLMGPGGLPATSYDNAGFWDSFYVGIDNGTPTLFGEIEPPGDENDPRSPAFKIGRTVKETSIYAEPLFVDGRGVQRQDALLHAAFVLNPIEPGQSPPVPASPAKPGSVAIAMSQCVYPLTMGPGSPPPKKPKPKAGGSPPLSPGGEGQGGTPPAGPLPTQTPTYPKGRQAREPLDGESVRSGSDITTVLENLRKVARLILPDDTSEENILERLNAALIQKDLSESEDGVESGVTRRAPPGAVEQSPPILMAFSAQQIDALVKANVINPATSKPFTKSELEANVPVQMAQPTASQTPTPPVPDPRDQAIAFLMGQTQNQAKAGRLARAKALVGRKVSQNYFDTHLKPLLDGFKMSYSQGPDGVLVESPNALDATLAALEAQPDLTRGILPASAPSALPHGQSLANVLNAIVMGQSGLDLAGLQLEANPYEGGNQISDADADALVNQVLVNTGYAPAVSHYPER